MATERKLRPFSYFCISPRPFNWLRHQSLANIPWKCSVDQIKDDDDGWTGRNLNFDARLSLCSERATLIFIISTPWSCKKQRENSLKFYRRPFYASTLKRKPHLKWIRSIGQGNIPTLHLSSISFNVSSCYYIYIWESMVKGLLPLQLASPRPTKERNNNFNGMMGLFVTLV